MGRPQELCVRLRDVRRVREDKVKIVELTEPLEQALIETPIGHVVISWDRLSDERARFYITPPDGYRLSDENDSTVPGLGSTLVVNV